MPANRRLALVAGLAVVLVGVAVTAWVLVGRDGSQAGDCTQVHDMLEYSTSGMQELTETALAGGDNPDAALAAYDARASTMREMASAIADPNLQATSLRLVDLDTTIVKVWADTVASPQPPGADPGAVSAATSEFTDAYRDYGQKHNRVVAELLAVCPED